MLVAGEKTAVVADTLCISHGTVKTHIKHIYEKCGVHTREELITLVTNEIENQP
ncbi:MAG: helix-turn-helix transcriptional regulator [Coriobacteriales bacterium]|nr:helix-turn-helix transcriptional regulator [Coriobacteriales bacterium]